MKATGKVSRGQHAKSWSELVNADFLHNNITADVTKKTMPCGENCPKPWQSQTHEINYNWMVR